MRIRQITGTCPDLSSPEAVLVLADDEEIWLMGSRINVGDLMREMEKLRAEGYQKVGMPITPPDDWVDPRQKQP